MKSRSNSDTAIAYSSSLFKQVNETTAANAIESIRAGDARTEIEALRATQDVDGHRKAKMDLPVLLWSGTFGSRKNDALKNHSGLLCLDFDDLDAPAEIRDKLATDPHTVAAFVSPSGNGCKLIVRVEATDAETHRACFATAEKYLRGNYKLTADPSGKDVARACFMSFDADLKEGKAEAVFVPALPAELPLLPSNRDHEWSPADVRRLLSHIPGRPSYEEWIRVISAVVDAVGPTAAVDLLCEWSPEEVPGEYSEKVRHRLHEVTIGSLVQLAKSYGWTPERRERPEAALEWDGTPEVPAVESREPQPPRGSIEWATPILSGMESRRFNADNPPPEEPPIIQLAGTKVSTAGNLTVISGQAATAKSHTAAAILAAAMTRNSEADCLGWSAPNEQGKAVVYLDFEMSPRHFHSLVAGSMRRAEITQPPDWLNAFNLTGLSPGEAFKALHALLVNCRKKHGGIHFALVDGYADFANSPNDEGESFDLIRQLHEMAIEFETAILGILHHNSGSESVKMRGHLGSQAERKAETVISLKRGGDDVITAFTTKARHAAIPEIRGPRFQWDEDREMFISAPSKLAIITDRKAEERRELAQAIFAERQGLTHAEAVSRIVEIEAIKPDAAKKRLAVLKRGNFVGIQSGTGFYHLGEA